MIKIVFDLSVFVKLLIVTIFFLIKNCKNMSNYWKLSIEGKLFFVKRAIENTLSTSEIAEAVNQYGYNVEKLTDGKRILDEAVLLCEEQERKYGDRYTISENKQTILEKAKKEYVKHVKLARIAFKDSAATFKQLGLNGKRADSMDGFLTEASLFYNLILNNTTFKEKMAGFGVIEEKILEIKQLLIEVNENRMKLSKAKSEAEQSTELRNKKLVEMDLWITSYIKVARVALEDNPQLLEALGISERDYTV